MRPHRKVLTVLGGGRIRIQRRGGLGFPGAPASSSLLRYWKGLGSHPMHYTLNFLEVSRNYFNA